MDNDRSRCDDTLRAILDALPAHHALVLYYREDDENGDMWEAEVRPLRNMGATPRKGFEARDPLDAIEGAIEGKAKPLPER